MKVNSETVQLILLKRTWILIIAVLVLFAKFIETDITLFIEKTVATNQTFGNSNYHNIIMKVD
jgi:hypothetical protein